MSRDKIKDAEGLLYAMALLLIISAWECASIITDYFQGALYKGSVSGKYHSSNGADDLVYAIKIKNKETIIAEFSKPVFVNQKVNLFCTDAAFEKASRCSGYTTDITKVRVLINKLKYIPVILLVVYFISLYRKHLLKGEP